jgi:hypothetical protein
MEYCFHTPRGKKNGEKIRDYLWGFWMWHHEHEHNKKLVHMMFKTN